MRRVDTALSTIYLVAFALVEDLGNDFCYRYRYGGDDHNDFQHVQVDELERLGNEREPDFDVIGIT